MQDLIQENPGITRTEPMEVDSQEVAPASGLPNLPTDFEPVYRDKGTPPKKGGGSSFTVTKLPSSLEPKGQRPL